MALTTYTSYVAIRGILGVADTEITDDTLSQPELEMEFVMDMNDVDAGVGSVLSQYVTIQGINESARTVDQTQLYNVVRLLAGYSVARKLLASAPMFAPLTITDGKAQTVRGDNPWDRLSMGVNGRYNNLKGALVKVLGKLLPNLVVSVAPVDRNYILGVPIGSDPVTGS